MEVKPMMSPSLKQMGHSHGPAGYNRLALLSLSPICFALGVGAGGGGGTSAGSDQLAASLAPTELASPRTLRGTSGFSL